jgi:Uma2 family endonuclease
VKRIAPNETPHTAQCPLVIAPYAGWMAIDLPPIRMMTMKHAVLTRLSEQDYLEGEGASPIRHEYVAGEVFAMAGASKAHNIISGNVFTLLRSALRGSACQTFFADMRVHIATQSSYYYPDVVVTCASGDLSSDAPKDRIESPSLIVEVLSTSTEAIDRREKMLAYRHIESLREYVLIDQERRWVEVYRRAGSGWVADLYSPGDAITLNPGTLNPATLDTVQLNVGMDDVYEGSGVA